MKRLVLFVLSIVLSCHLFAQAPVNNDCANATNIPLGTTASGTLRNATNQNSIGSCGTNKDVWYKFTVTPYIAGIMSTTGSPMVITVTRTNTGSNNLSNTDTNIELFSAISNTSTCTGTTSVTGGCQTIASPRSFANLAAGTYYIRVNTTVGTPNTTATFTISVVTPPASRMNEVFKRTVLSGASVMDNPWEVTYGADGYLWVTESKSYKVQRIDPNTSVKTLVLDITQGSTFLPVADRPFNRQTFNVTGANSPQGGLAGLALHPQFMDPDDPKNYVYISYVHSLVSNATSTGIGTKFLNRLVRFTFNTTTNKLESPVSICDTLPGSNDHNSQRIIIAPITANGTPYLFYASGDMGAGQGNNYDRPVKTQIPASYEGKILRFNLEEDADGAQTPTNYNRWIPNDNPYNTIVGKQSAVWNIGMRNNQGFAYDSTTNTLYGTSHGPYSDDELNIIERFKNYGHPLVIGYYSDGNYNGTTTPISSTSYSAGSPFGSYGGFSRAGVSTCPPIGNETTRRNEINAMGYGAYQDPLFSAYAYNIAGQPNVSTIWSQSGNTPGNNLWPSEGWSGLELYTKTYIPGWKRSLVAAGLKWGRLLRLKLSDNGQATLPSGFSQNNVGDTVTLLQSSNRYRDLAFDPNGRDIYIVMDNSASSVAADGNPTAAPACQGCLIKYTFLGYADNGGKSNIPTSIDVTEGTANACAQGTSVTIDNTNNNLWVPITGPDGDILAEIKANGNNLGTITSSFYRNAGTVREDGKNRLYLDRNISITPQTQPTSPVDVRLYLTANELTALRNATNSKGITSGVTDVNSLAIFKNNDICGTNIQANAPKITPTYTEAHGANGFVVQAQVSSFSTFYFGSNGITALPLELLTFKGSLQNNAAYLQWETTNEINTAHFAVERSMDGNNFSTIGTVAAAGTSTTTLKYSYTDYKATQQPATKLYYRLKLVDADGKYSYSKTVTIDLSAAYTVTMRPNPIKDVLKIQLSLAKAQRVQIHVVDINGRTIHQEAKFVAEGQTELEINAKNWPAQTYAVRITGSDNKPLAVQNVIKL
jgi:PQQ-dependent dehydrogenase (s-GDH family)